MGDSRGSLCGRGTGATLCQTQAVLASSETEPVQDTAELFHHVCGTSLKMYLRAKNSPGREEGGTNSKKKHRSGQGQKRRGSSSRVENISTSHPMEDLIPEQRGIS